MLIIFVSLVSRQLSKCLLQLLRDRLVLLLLEHQIILKTVDLQVRMIYMAKAFVGENRRNEIVDLPQFVIFQHSFQQTLLSPLHG